MGPHRRRLPTRHRALPGLPPGVRRRAARRREGRRRRGTGPDPGVGLRGRDPLRAHQAAGEVGKGESGGEFVGLRGFRGRTTAAVRAPEAAACAGGSRFFVLVILVPAVLLMGGCLMAVGFRSFSWCAGVPGSAPRCHATADGQHCKRPQGDRL